MLAAVLFLLGSGLVLCDPLYRAYVEKFQALLAGVFAIIAAGVAYYGAVSAARIQSQAILEQTKAQGQAILEQTKAQAEAQRARDEAERSLARTNFRMAVLLAAHHLRNDLRAKKDIIAEMTKTQGAVTPDSLHVFRVTMNPILSSGWRDLTLLDPARMEQIIALQNFVAGINDAVMRLELQGPELPKELVEDLDEHYTGALQFIAKLTPESRDNT
jgi:hypothetical protein